MSLDDLNHRVTTAILVAESFPPGSRKSQRAFREVAELEEEIATLVDARVVEGGIARLGAVAASLSAGEPLRAIQLGARYLADELSDGVRAKLTKFVSEADAEIVREVSDETKVDPVRFHLHAA